MSRKNRTQDVGLESATESFGSGLGALKPLRKAIKIGSRADRVPLKMRDRAEAGTKQGIDGDRARLDDA